MKKLLLGLGLLSSQLMAQNAPGLLDSAVRYGKLDNGFTYYILHNEEPKNRASFYIVQNVGAMLEDDDQDGLAHMLEHMAFNGSDNFPDKGVKNFLERQGVSFGSNINAYTNLDETVYNISNVPTEKPAVMDSCVLILHDWSGSLTLAGEEIDAERGVIHEEWRTRNGPGRRLYKQIAPYKYYHSKYAERDVIGSMDVIDHSDYEAIRRFYHTWYRPDLQAAVIVGDFDVDEMEARVKRILSTVPKPVNAAERLEYQVESNKEMLYTVATDKEATTTNFTYNFKHPVVPRNQKNEDYLKSDMEQSLIAMMIDSRFREILEKPGAPFLNASVGYFNDVRTMDVFAVNGTARENEVLTAIEAILTEVERARRYGFAESELERARKEMLTSYESQYKLRNKVSNDRLAKQLQGHYLTGEPRPGIVAEYELARTYLPTVTTDQLMPYLSEWITDTNSVFIITGPDKEGVSYPEESAVTQVIERVKKGDLQPYEDGAADLVLLQQVPEPGTVIRSGAYMGQKEATEYQLSNGAKVVLLPTDFAESQVLFSAISWGGKSKLSLEQLPTAEFLSDFTNRMGIGTHSVSELEKILAGKNLSLTVGLDHFTESMSGQSDKSDLEAFMQLLYMTFAEPRFDQEAFDAYLQRMRPYFENMAQNPQKVFQDSLLTVMSGKSPRRPLINKAILDRLSYDAFQSVYEARFAHPGDFTFYFVGDFETDELLPLVLRYIGGVSGTAIAETWQDDGVRPPKESFTRRLTFPMETPKYINYIQFYDPDFAYSPSANMAMNITRSVLSNWYFESMREKEGGTYGARVSINTSKVPARNLSMSITFDSNPDKGERLLEIVDEEYKRLVTEGASEDDFQKAKASMIKEREQYLKDNHYLLGLMQMGYTTGYNRLLPVNYEELLDKITVKKYNKQVKKLLGPSADICRYELVMTPAE